MISTAMHNIDYSPEIYSFRIGKKVNTVRLVHAIHDLLLKDPKFFDKDEGPALMHSFLVSVYGPNYKLDGKQARERLDRQS